MVVEFYMFNDVLNIQGDDDDDDDRRMINQSRRHDYDEWAVTFCSLGSQVFLCTVSYILVLNKDHSVSAFGSRMPKWSRVFYVV